MEVTVNYRGAILDLEGDFISACDGIWEEEPIGDSFETEKVMAGGIDITDILSFNQMDELDLLAIETIG